MMSTTASHEADLSVLLQESIAALRQSSGLIERYVWSVAPEEAAEAQANNHRAIRALRTAHASVPVRSDGESAGAPELCARS